MGCSNACAGCSRASRSRPPSHPVGVGLKSFVLIATSSGTQAGSSGGRRFTLVLANFKSGGSTLSNYGKPLESIADLLAAGSRRRSRRGVGRKRQQFAREGRARLVEQRRDRRGEGAVLGRREFDDLAALCRDGAARGFLLLDMQGALEGDRIRHGGAHGALQLGRP